MQIPRCGASGRGHGVQLGVAQCLGTQAFCQEAQYLEREVPHAKELADLLQITLPGI